MAKKLFLPLFYTHSQRYVFYLLNFSYRWAESLYNLFTFILYLCNAKRSRWVPIEFLLYFTSETPLDLLFQIDGAGGSRIHRQAVNLIRGLKKTTNNERKIKGEETVCTGTYSNKANKFFVERGYEYDTTYFDKWNERVIRIAAYFTIRRMSKTNYLNCVSGVVKWDKHEGVGAARRRHDVCTTDAVIAPHRFMCPQ